MTYIQQGVGNILRDVGPYWHDSITQFLQICRLNIHDVNLSFHHIPKVLYWMRSGDCGGHLSKVKLIAMFKKPVWDYLSFGDMVHYPAGSSIRRWVHCSHKGMDMVSNNTQVGLWRFKRCSIGTKGPKVCQENILHTITPPTSAWTVETRQDGSLLLCSLSQILTLPSECRSRNRDSSDQETFSNLLLSNFGEPVWIISSVSCSYLTGAAPGVVFCCL